MLQGLPGGGGGGMGGLGIDWYITQPWPQVFSVIGSIIFGGLHFWRHWLNMAKILSKFGEQQLVMVKYACGFNQSETGK